jgi:CheY-like chemotaxis protein
MKKVLVIDDEKGIRALVRAALKPGFEVTEAANGVAGYDLAVSSSPHLILCDVHMAELNGFATLTKLRKHPATRSTPFIFLTGFSTPSDVRRGMELGADDYLPKPFEVNTLRAAVNARLLKHDQTQTDMNAKAQRLHQSIASTLPHELLGPMDNLLSLTELIGKGYRHFDGAEIIAMSRDAHRVATRVRQQIENCLLFAELVLLREEPNRQSQWRERRMVHVLDIVQPIVVQKAKERQRGNDMRVSFSYCHAYIHPRSLRKIVEEIMDNAFKFSKLGTPIEVSVFSDHGRGLIQITDCGPGITPDEIAKLGAFVRFEQKLVEANGCGLGLTIAKGLVELNGGQFDILPGKNGGTTVRILFPALANVN